MLNGQKSHIGFTLAELLIALAILGVIATFTIPKVLVSQQNGKWNAIAKEAVSMVSGSYEILQLNNTATASTKPADLTSAMNYVKIITDGTTQVDDQQGGGALTCDVATPCLKLYNDAILWANSDGFGGTGATTNLFYFMLDPDGVYSGTTNGPGKSLPIYLYYNGRVLSPQGIYPNSTDASGFIYGPCACEPDWFSWN